MAILSIWGIIFVVMGHSGFTNEIISERLSGLQKWIYSFHMPLFFFISGYLFSLTNKSLSNIQSGKFIKKKLKRLMIPYFVLGTIIFFIKYLFAGLASVERSFSIGSFFYMFFAPSAVNSTMGFLWYLITLFCIFCITLVLSKLHINLRNISICLLLIAATYLLNTIIPNVEVLNFSAVLHYMPFFLLGICTQAYRFENAINKFSTITLIANALIGGGIQIALIASSDYLQISSGIRLILTACCGIWFSICICRLILLNTSLSKLILPFAPMVYTIYLLSWFGQYPIQITSINLLHLNWLLSFALIFIGGIVFPVLVYTLCRKLKSYKFYRIISLVIGL